MSSRPSVYIGDRVTWSAPYFTPPRAGTVTGVIRGDGFDIVAIAYDAPHSLYASSTHTVEFLIDGVDRGFTITPQEPNRP